MQSTKPEKPRIILICGSVDSESLRFLEKVLSHAGHSCQRIFYLSQSEYRQGQASRGLARLKFRLGMYLGFTCTLIRKILSAPKNSTLIVTTNPFFAPFLAGLFSRLRSLTIVQLLYDLYPDAIEASSGRKLPRLLTLPLQFLNRATLRLVSGTVYLGPLLKSHVAKCWGMSRQEAIIDIGCDEDYFKELSPIPSPQVKKIHFGGQFGHMHDIENMLTCLAKAFDFDPSLRKNFDFSFHVSGPFVSLLKQYSEDFSLQLFDPSPDWPRVVSLASLGLVSLSPRGATVCLPSRTYAMMAGGQAIIAICPKWSDLAHIILENNAGWVINNSPFNTREELLENYPFRIAQHRELDAIAKELTELFELLLKNPFEIEQRRASSLQAAKLRYSTEPIAIQWSKFLDSL